MNKAGILLLLSVLLLSSCNKKLSGIFYGNRTTDRLTVNNFNFEYLTAKTKVDFMSPKNDVSGTANMRLRKDSVIWVSLSPGLGIEAARILITSDSVFLMNKMDKQYSVMSFSELSKKFDFDINYDLIQSVILGNLIYPYEREKVMRNSEMYAYKQQQGKFFFENFIGAKTMKLEKLQVEDTVSRNTISVNYSDFQLVDEEILPFRITARLNYKDTSKDATTVYLEYKQMNLEKKPLKFPFNVPTKYERK